MKMFLVEKLMFLLLLVMLQVSAIVIYSRFSNFVIVLLVFTGPYDCTPIEHNFAPVLTID